MITLVRKEFDKGNDSRKKVTDKAGTKPRDIIKAFRTAPEVAPRSKPSDVHSDQIIAASKNYSEHAHTQGGDQ
jgi:hypothetical protein